MSSPTHQQLNDMVAMAQRFRALGLEDYDDEEVFRLGVHAVEAGLKPEQLTRELAARFIRAKALEDWDRRARIDTSGFTPEQLRVYEQHNRECEALIADIMPKVVS